ncbi:hypothetical protein E4U32_004765 [Claviceps aff. humidiphila group G2b]|nr:hypothetical protein E4U32_004765 [Claviceps aff. humidiphila group G2b]
MTHLSNIESQRKCERRKTLHDLFFWQGRSYKRNVPPFQPDLASRPMALGEHVGADRDKLSTHGAQHDCKSTTLSTGNNNEVPGA